MASPPTATPPLHTALHMAAWTTTKEPPSWIGEFYDMLCVKAQGYNLKGPSPRKLDFFPIGDRPVLHGILVLTSTGPPFLRRASRLHLSGARLRLSCFRGEGCPGSSAFSRRIRPPESKYRRWGIGARYGCPAPSVSGGCFSGNLAQGRAVIDARNARGLTALHSACSVGNAEMVKSLLQAGAGPPPLVLASRSPADFTYVRMRGGGRVPGGGFDIRTIWRARIWPRRLRNSPGTKGGRLRAAPRYRRISP